MTSSYEQLALSTWSSLTADSPPVGGLASKQQNWDKAVVSAEFGRLLTDQTSDSDKARLLAVSSPHRGDWLYALSVSNLGLLLDYKAIRDAVYLSLGTNLCQSHKCPCGSLVDQTGTHGLSCKKSSSRIIRHNALNDIICRSLARADVPAVKEPSGISRSDGKRPDGVTQIPWVSGKCLTWDVTVTDTLATSYVNLSSVSAGSAAESAASRKVTKYSGLTSTYEFVPIAFETLGPLNASGHSFLYQRLSIAMQRYNALAFRGSFEAAEDRPVVDSDLTF